MQQRHALRVSGEGGGSRNALCRSCDALAERMDATSFGYHQYLTVPTVRKIDDIELLIMVLDGD